MVVSAFPKNKLCLNIIMTFFVFVGFYIKKKHQTLIREV